jgi:hypothetical protein
MPVALSLLLGIGYRAGTLFCLSGKGTGTPFSVFSWPGKYDGPELIAPARVSFPVIRNIVCPAGDAAPSV